MSTSARVFTKSEERESDTASRASDSARSKSPRSASTRARAPRHSTWEARSSSAAASSLTIVKRSASSVRPCAMSARAMSADIVDKTARSPISSSAANPLRSWRSAA